MAQLPCWVCGDDGVGCMQAYAIPAYQFDIKLCKTNRPPHSAVRAPGKFESPLIMEHIIEHVAARLDMDPVKVRELNFLKTPAPGQSPNLVIVLDTWPSLLLKIYCVRQSHEVCVLESCEALKDDNNSSYRDIQSAASVA